MSELSQMPLGQIAQLYGQNARHAADGRIISFTVKGYKFRLNNIVHSQKIPPPPSDPTQGEFHFQTE